MRFKSMDMKAVAHLLETTSKRGGLTIGATHKNGYGISYPDKGYAVGGYSSVITVNNHDSDKLCAALVNNLIKAKNEEGVNDGDYMGLWVNEIGDIEIEFSRVYNSLSEAMSEAKKLKQLYIYDFKNSRALKV